MKNHSQKLLAVIIGAALIAAPIVSAAQNTASNTTGGISNYDLLQQIRNLQQEVAELRDRIDRQEYEAQRNRQQSNRLPQASNSQTVNSQSNDYQTTAPIVLPGGTLTDSQANLPSYPPAVQTTSPEVSIPANATITNNGPLVEERDLSGAVPLGQSPEAAAQATQGTVQTSTQTAPVDSVDTSLRVEDRVISAEQPAPVVQARPSSSVANPQAELLARGDKAIQTSLQEEDLYAKGLDQLKQQQYEQAVSLFNSQLQAYPRGQRSADAYYWIGESLYILENLESSKKSYQSILTLFPSSRRVPNALFKVAKIENEQGNQIGAKATLQSLLARYPSSSAAAQAKATLADLL